MKLANGSVLQMPILPIKYYRRWRANRWRTNDLVSYSGFHMVFKNTYQSITARGAHVFSPVLSVSWFVLKERHWPDQPCTITHAGNRNLPG